MWISMDKSGSRFLANIHTDMEIHIWPDTNKYEYANPDMITNIDMDISLEPNIRF